jgi:broad specificity phosphatase PhoE
MPLAQQLIPYDLDLIVTSTELKAIETGELTAQYLGIPYRIESNLQEHARQTAPYFLSKEEFQEAVITLLEKPAKLVFGEETGLQARERFAGGIEAVMKTYPQENIAIVTHGTVLSLFVSHHTGLEIISFWRELGMPAIVAFSYPGMKLLSQINEIV